MAVTAHDTTLFPTPPERPTTMTDHVATSLGFAVLVTHKTLPERRDEVRAVWEKHMARAVQNNPGHLSRGSTDTVEAWAYGDQLVYFKSESVALTEAADGGATEYVISGQSGEVTVAALGQESSDTPPDVDAAIRDANRYAGRLDLRLRCDPGL
ncbi:hypothetical protein [Microbacterium binotii]|uniref:hypothetical protein n=1 Tax=Microbacterium binotii TaxID=462710 RepID=UPI001F35C213|nr:hypothetical protein [Microbacterium binotii]UIN31318.1 hypothetical protein LXM64_03685 [Microbacterium binotii]